MERRGVRWTVVAFALVQILLASTVLGYRWVSSSPEATVADALEQYREREPRGPAPPTGTTPAPSPTPAPTPDTPPEATPEPEPQTADPEPEPTPDGTPAAAPPARILELPDPGVYEWETDGWEQAAGIRRDLPERSVRIISHEGPRRWMNEHRYSEDHVEWFPFDLTDAGLFCESYRNRIRFGPVGGESTITYDPPARFTAFPLEAGTAWTGSWEGDTRGTYEGRIVKQTTIRVAGEDIEAWQSELHMRMSGELEGTVDTTVWVSIEHGMSVRESYSHDITTDQGTYRGEWTITLLSTDPQQ